MISKFVAFFGYPHPQRIAPLVGALAGNADLRREGTAVLDDIVERTSLTRPDMFWCYARVAPKNVFFELVGEAVIGRHPWVPWIPVMIDGSLPELVEDPRWKAFLTTVNHPGVRSRMRTAPRKLCQ